MPVSLTRHKQTEKQGLGLHRARVEQVGELLQLGGGLQEPGVQVLRLALQFEKPTRLVGPLHKRLQQVGDTRSEEPAAQTQGLLAVPRQLAKGLQHEVC